MPASEQNKKLFQAVQETAASIGFSVSEEFRAGVSDANLIAGEHTPVIDGLGPIGAMDHSEDEYMIKASLLQRSALLACTLIDCWEKYQKRSFIPIENLEKRLINYRPKSELFRLRKRNIYPSGRKGVRS